MEKLSNLTSVEEREAVLLEEIAYMIKPRSQKRTMKIAKSILKEMRSLGPKLINIMYNEPLMNALTLDHMYRVSIDEAESDAWAEASFAHMFKERGLEKLSTSRSPTTLHCNRK